MQQEQQLSNLSFETLLSVTSPCNVFASAQIDVQCPQHVPILPNPKSNITSDEIGL